MSSVFNTFLLCINFTKIPTLILTVWNENTLDVRQKQKKLIQQFGLIDTILKLLFPRQCAFLSVCVGCTSRSYTLLMLSSLRVGAAGSSWGFKGVWVLGLSAFVCSYG